MSCCRWKPETTGPTGTRSWVPSTSGAIRCCRPSRSTESAGTRRRTMRSSFRDRNRLILLLALVVLALGAIQCGSDDDPQPDLDELLPLETGNNWSYRYTFLGTEHVRSDTVLPAVEVDGVRWYPTTDDAFIFPRSKSTDPAAGARGAGAGRNPMRV